MEKEEYTTPEMEIIFFEYEDIIITSGKDGEFVPTNGMGYDPNRRMWFTTEENE